MERFSGGGSKSLTLHCIIHQQFLYVNCLDISEVLKPAMSVINYFKSHGLSNREFREFLKEIKENGSPYYNAVR